MKLRIYNKTLDPNIWNENKTIKPEIRDNLLKIAEDFYNSTDLTGEIHDILFLGSSANYNWTPMSDIDLHVVIDIAEEKINEEYARKFMDSLGFKWNTEHDIEVKGHPVEVYLQDLREPNSNAKLSRPGAAIYSLFDGRWLQEPNKLKIKLDADKIRKKFRLIQEKVKRLVETSDIEKLKELMKSIRNYRNSGLASGGEFSVENLVFKALRRSGDLKKIKDTINTVYDKKVSIPEHGNMQPSTETTPMNESDNRLYTLVGSINPHLEVVSIKDCKDSLSHCHLGVWGYRYGDKRWRYNSLKNTVYLPNDISDPVMSEKEKDAIRLHLEKKYGIINPKFEVSNGYFSHGHNIVEGLDEEFKLTVFLIVGMINKDLEILSYKDFYGRISHEAILKENPHYSYDHITTIFWRYKSKNDTLYWTDEPTEKQRFVVLDYLSKIYKIVKPRQSSDVNDISSHTIDESLEEIMCMMESKGERLFFNE